MTNEMASFITDLADVLEKHGGGLTTMLAGGGIYAAQGSECECLRWPMNGDVAYLREIVRTGRSSPEPPDRPTDHRVEDIMKNDPILMGEIADARIMAYRRWEADQECATAA